VAIFWELSHVQEALDELNKAIGDPSSLPDTIEQVRKGYLYFYKKI